IGGPHFPTRHFFLHNVPHTQANRLTHSFLYFPPRFGVSQYADLHKPRAARKIARFMGFSCKASRSYASFASRLRRPPTGIGGSSYPGAHASSESVWSTSYSARSSFVRYGSHFSKVIIYGPDAAPHIVRNLSGSRTSSRYSGSSAWTEHGFRSSPARKSCRSRAPFRVLHGLHASA